MERPSTRNMASGIPTAATNPSGSRTKIRISSQVSFKSPRMMAASVADDVPGELEEHVLERREHGAKVANGERVAGDETNDRGDEVVAPPLHRVRGALDAHRPGSRDALELAREALAIAGEHDAALGAVLADQVGGRAHLDE